MFDGGHDSTESPEGHRWRFLNYLFKNLDPEEKELKPAN